MVELENVPSVDKDVWALKGISKKIWLGKSMTSLKKKKKVWLEVGFERIIVELAKKLR